MVSDLQLPAIGISHSMLLNSGLSLYPSYESVQRSTFTFGNMPPDARLLLIEGFDWAQTQDVHLANSGTLIVGPAADPVGYNAAMELLNRVTSSLSAFELLSEPSLGLEELGVLVDVLDYLDGQDYAVLAKELRVDHVYGGPAIILDIESDTDVEDGSYQRAKRAFWDWWNGSGHSSSSADVLISFG